VRIKVTDQPPLYPTSRTENIEYISYALGEYVDCDFTFLPFECHRAELSAMAMTETPPEHVLTLGTGAGCFPSFLHHNFPNLHVTTVDIDSEVVKIAVEHFGLKETDRLKSIVMDALLFVENTEERYDVIFVDINNEDLKDMIPPAPFRTDGFLERCKSILTDRGVLVVNTISLNTRPVKKFRRQAKRLFSSVLTYECEEELNHVYYLLKENESPVLEVIVERM
jgi:spermidine synthase